MTVSFWDCIPLEKKVRIYEILANIHMADTGELLDRPPGMFGEDTRPLVTIDASDYEEMQEIETAKEMRKPPHPSAESRK